jgi:hypothetical protein
MPDDEELPDEIVKQLYELPPDAFVAARTEMAKRLKAEGDSEAAQAVGRLRKPSASVWAANRLASEDAKDIDKLFAANDALRSAMAATGRDAGERYRRASDERQRLVARLVERAGTILHEASLSAARTYLDRVTATLMATATDEAGADRLRRGVLEQDLSPAGGFGQLFGGEPADTAEGTGGTGDAAGVGTRKGRAPTKDGDARRRRETLERLEREAEERTAEAKAAEAAARDAEREADVAEREADRATKVAATRRRDATRARAEAERARERAGAATERVRDASR